MRLDRELSELERALLDSHLEACAACTSFAVHVTATARALRAAPLEAPSRALELPLRRRTGFGAGNAAAWLAGAAAAAAALLAVTVLPSNRIEGPPSVRPVPSTNRDLDELRILRRAQMMPAGLILSRPARGAEL